MLRRVLVESQSADYFFFWEVALASEVRELLMRRLGLVSKVIAQSVILTGGEGIVVTEKYALFIGTLIMDLE